MIPGITVGNYCTNSAHLSADHVTIRNSGAGAGIALDTGAVADITNSTILDNGESGIGTSRGSVITLSGNTISGSPEGVTLGTGSVGWLDGNTISTSISADSAALGVSYGSTVKLNGGNTLTSNGFALYVQNGSTLIQHQHGHERITGPVQITIDSNAEFRNVEINGPVEVSDHSLLRMRDRSGNPTNVSVKGNMSVSQDSGLNFIKNAGDQRVKVKGNITCADTESSISASASNVTIIGQKIGCTGYDQVSN